MPRNINSSPSSRRVPEADRRRAQLSCDRCKTKRTRCVRPSGEQPCISCRDLGIACQTKIPRKPAPGAFEHARYEALGALVQRIFPTEDCDDVETLLRLATKISTPQLPTGHSWTDTHDQETDHSRVSGFPHVQGELPASAPSILTLSNDNVQSPQSSIGASVPWPYNIDQAIQGTVTNLPEETCLPAPHGVAHYVGPSSSFEFANAVRRLVTLRSVIFEDVMTRQDLRSKLRAEFANLKTSIALEPRIPTHPASSVREHSDAEVDMQPSPNQNVHSSRGPMSGGNSATLARSPLLENSLQALIPKNEVADKLLKAFFDRLHPNYVLFHRGTFHTRYDTIWQRAPTYRNNREPGWLCSLFLVFVFGAQILERDGIEDSVALQRTNLKLVRDRFHHLALTASLENVQALLLLQLYEHNAGERNTSWILLGQATRMAVALGMHREGTSHNFDSMERNTRRMVWFTLYSFEQYVSLSLGRPSAIKALEVNVRLPDEAILDGGDYPQDYLYYASTLLDLTSKVRHFATAASPNCFDESVLNSMLDSLAAISRELRNWKKQLPRHLRPEWSFISQRHLRAVLLLHMTYHHISSVLTRPYLLCKVEKDIKSQGGAGDGSSDAAITRSISNVLKYAQDCISSSLAVANILNRLSSGSLLESVAWTDFFYLYHAILALCLDFLGRRQFSASVEWTAREREISASVSFMIEMCQTNPLGPTYQILSQVAIHFAHIVRLAGDDGLSRDDPEQIQVGTVVESVSEQTNELERPRPAVTPATATNVLPDLFVPFGEPIFGVNQFGNNNDGYWDFFNINGPTSMEGSFDPTLQYLMSSTQDPFGYGFPVSFGGFHDRTE